VDSYLPPLSLCSKNGGKHGLCKLTVACEEALHVVDVSAAGWVAACDSPICILHNAWAAVRNRDEDAVAVVPALHAHQALICRRVAQPPVSST